MLKDMRSLLPSLCELCCKCCHPVNILYLYERLGEHIDRWHMWRAEQPFKGRFSAQQWWQMPLITAFGRQGISEFENNQDYTENSCPPSPHSQIPHLQRKGKEKAGSHQKALAGVNLTDFCRLGARIKDVCQYTQQFYRKTLDLCASKTRLHTYGYTYLNK